MKFKAFRYPKYLQRIFYVLLTVLLVTGCGGGGSDSESAGGTDESGTLAVSLTDAPGDFGSYTVDVLGLTLTKANGAQISTMPLSTRIDFAQYTEMTEFLTAATVPAGAYIEATLTLDYGDADIWVEGPDGELIQAARILDESGDPLGVVEVAVQLSGRNRLVIAPGIPIHLMLDFDLNATNRVVFDDLGEATVTVDPYLIADLNRSGNKLHRLRGLLDGVDTAGSTFSVFIRPFYCALSGPAHPFGNMTVYTDADTLYEINEEEFQGSDGLDAMVDLDHLSAVVAVGDLRFNPLRFEATQVYAGTSVPWGAADVVSGSVVARNGDVLTVKGATLVRSDGSAIFHDLVTVDLGEDTRVTRQLSREGFTIDDISVGQRVTIFGTLTNEDPLDLALDATAGHVRMQITAVRGTVTDVAPDDPAAQLDIALQSINQHRVDIFDFSGTGTESGNDADPANYEIATDTLDITGLDFDAPVKVRGFVQPFGLAPADFNAHTIIDVSSVRAFLKVQWDPATSDAFEAITESGLTLNLEGVGMPHHIFRAWMVTDLTALTLSPVVAPSEAGQGLYILRGRGPIYAFTSYEEYADELANQLSDGGSVQKVWSVGSYDDASATLTAEIIDIQLR